MISSLSAQSKATPPDDAVCPRDGSANRRTEPTNAVLHKLTDSEREAAIHRAGLLIESSMKEWEETGCFAARGRAIYAQQCMERLIKGRSPEYVAKIERERGLL